MGSTVSGRSTCRVVIRPRLIWHTTLLSDPGIRACPAGRQSGIEKPAGFVVSAFEELKPEMKAKHYWYLRESASILHHPDILQSLFNACGLLKVMSYQG